MEKERETAIERLCREKDPEMDKLKQVILNIFDGEGSLHILQIEEALAKTGIVICEDIGSKKGARVKMVLAELCRKCKLYAVPSYDDHTGLIAVFCFAPIKTISSEDVLEISVNEIVKTIEEEEIKTL